jgi:hypothetical protein
MKTKLVHGVMAITSAAGVLGVLRADAAVRSEDIRRLFPKLSQLKKDEDVEKLLLHMKTAEDLAHEVMPSYVRELVHGNLLTHVYGVMKLAQTMKMRLDLVEELCFIVYGQKRTHGLMQRNHLKVVLNHDRDSKQQLGQDKPTHSSKSQLQVFAVALKHLVTEVLTH